MKNTLTLAAAIALSTLSMNAIAGQAYVRAELGGSDTEARDGGYRASESDGAAKLGGGYWFTPNIALEAHIGSLYSEYLGNGHDFDLISYGLGVAAKKNFGSANTGFFVGARAGIARMVAQIRDDYDVDHDEGSTKPYYGASIGYDFSNHWGLSLNYDRHSGEFSGTDVDIDVYTIGGEYRF